MTIFQIAHQVWLTWRTRRVRGKFTLLEYHIFRQYHCRVKAKLHSERIHIDLQTFSTDRCSCGHFLGDHRENGGGWICSICLSLAYHRPVNREWPDSLDVSK